MTAPHPRILHVNWRDLRNPLAGGAEVHAHQVYTRLVARGWPVTFVSHAPRGLPREEVQDGIRIVRAGGAFTFNYTVMLRLRRWVRDEGAGIVVDDSNKIAFYAPLYSPVPVVAHIHHLFGSAVWRETSPPFAAYVRLAESLVPPVYRRTPTMTGSASARRELLALGLRDVTDVGEGVDLAGFSAPAPGERDRDLLLYLGRVKKYKGLDMLLHALARLAPGRPRLRLSVAGSGDDVPRLQALAQELGIGDRVVFHGRVSEQEKIDLYRRSAVCLNASVKEGWGLTSIEANGCGTPVVATDVPGLCDSVRDGVTGYLVPFGDAVAMADRVARILDDEALAARMEKESLAWAAWHTWDRVADRTEDVLLRRLGLPQRHSESRAEAA